MSGKTKINIGTIIDLEDLLQSRLLIQANSGGGKSVLARTIIEEAVGKVPFIIMDLEGEYYTLKEKYGDILIIGGQHSDVPINMKSAELLPKEIVGNQLSVVIDLSDWKMPERVLYAKYFLEALMDLNHQYWTNYLIFIEEAHKLCGEQDKQASASAVKDLMSRGRKRGYCGILITQRIAKLHKDAAAECNNKFIGRTFMDIDVDRASKELGFTAKTDKNILRDLTPGNFYAFGTSITPHEVHVIKVNMPKTKIPKAGMNMEIKTKQPTDKIKAMLVKLNTLPGETKKEAKVSIATSPSHINIPTKPVKTYEDEYKSALATNKDLVSQINDKDKRIISLQDIIKSAVKSLGGHVPVTTAKTAVPTVHAPIKEVTHKKEVIAKVKTSSEPITGLSKCPMTIIKFLATYPEKSFSKQQIGIATSYSRTSGGFKNALSELNTKSLIIKDLDKIKVDGRAFDLLGPNFETKQYSANTFTHNLSKCEREIYDILLANPEESFTKEELAAKTPSNYSNTSGGYKNAISTLNTLELIRRESGQIKLNPDLLELL